MTYQIQTEDGPATLEIVPTNDGEIYRLQWMFYEEEEGLEGGAYVGDMGVESSDPVDQAALKSTPYVDVEGFHWETERAAKKALKLIEKIMNNNGREPAGWEKIALANGWTPPAGLVLKY